MKWLFLIPTFLMAQYGFFVQKGDEDVSCIQIYGEMHSGTNYLEMLLKNNFPKTPVFSGLSPKKRIFSQKHFPAWFTKPLSYHSSLGIDERFWTLDNSKDTLFIVIVRDPYNWVRALYKRPYHIRQARTFSAFIKRDVQFKISKDRINAIDLNPETGKFFSNPLTMRSAKLANILYLPQKVSHCFFINYESLRDYPQQVLDEIAQRYSVAKNRQFVPIKTYKSTEKVYTGSRYFPISEKDLTFINSQIDWSIEEKFGYKQKSRVD